MPRETRTGKKELKSCIVKANKNTKGQQRNERNFNVNHSTESTTKQRKRRTNEVDGSQLRHKVIKSRGTRTHEVD